MHCRLERTCLYMLAVQFVAGFSLIAIYHAETSFSVPKTRQERIRTQTTPRKMTTHSRDVNITDSTVGMRVFSGCGNIQCPVHLVSKDTWYTVDSSKLDLVFSAFYNEITAELVVIGARGRRYGRGFIARNYVCQLWFQTADGNMTMEEDTALARDLSETHGKLYCATKYTCRVSSKKRPTFVSIVTGKCGAPSNLLRVQLSSPPKQYKRTFTVCLAPLNFNYNKTNELIEWIELNRLLGADKFTIYNFSSALNVKVILDYYLNTGIVEVVQWQMPIRVITNDKKHNPEIHYYGQLVALQECLYRNKHESEFVVNLDLDEFVIPRQNNSNTWYDILQGRNTSGAFIFRNTFFKKEWADTDESFPEKSLAIKYNLVTLLKTKHEVKISRHRQRSKYFARTSKVDRLMIHDVPGLTGSDKPELVAMETALLHHYRNWYQYNDTKAVKVNDNIVVTKYATNLTQAVEKIWRATQTG